MTFMGIFLAIGIALFTSPFLLPRIHDAQCRLCCRETSLIKKLIPLFIIIAIYVIAYIGPPIIMAFFTEIFEIFMNSGYYFTMDEEVTISEFRCIVVVMNTLALITDVYAWIRYLAIRNK